MKVVLVASGKGGTGKTTITSYLGMMIAELYKKNVGILDLDVTGPNIPHVLGINKLFDEVYDKDWFYPVKFSKYLEVFSPAFLYPEDVACSWSGEKRKELIHELILKVKWDDPKLILCDSPPGTSDEIIAVLKYLNIYGAIIVTNSKKVSMLDAKKLISLLTNRKYNINILGVVDNMSYMKIGSRYQLLFSESEHIDITKELGINVLTRIPFTDNIICELKPLAEMIVELLGGL